jgi:hypothetical protein
MESADRNNTQSDCGLIFYCTRRVGGNGFCAADSPEIELRGPERF